MQQYHLQGTDAAYLSGRYREEDPLIWIDGQTTRERAQGAGHGGWETLWDYAAQYEHPYWKAHGAIAREAGHGGGDYFIIQDFVDAITSGAPPAIDVYDAATWSSVYPLSMQSASEGGRPVPIPDFRRGSRAT